MRTVHGELAMGVRRRHQNPAVPGTSAIAATRTGWGAVIARTLRTRWWPRVLVAGALIAVLGIMLLSGTAQALVAALGALVFLSALLQAMGAGNRTPTDLQESHDRLARLRSSSIGSRREPPAPPGNG
jgi:hypothetical protein